MVIYEITAVVDGRLAADYERYMKGRHIPDLLATGHFASASFSRSGARYRICYEAHDRAALDKYIAEHAERLRRDFHEHFPIGVELSREIWDVVDSFDGTVISS